MKEAVLLRRINDSLLVSNSALNISTGVLRDNLAIEKSITLKYQGLNQTVSESRDYYKRKFRGERTKKSLWQIMFGFILAAYAKEKLGL